MTSRPDRPAVDPRVARSRTRILAATVEELTERGWTGMTIEGVAARAGVGKATIYRHFGGKAALVAEAIEDHLAEIAVPDTGDLRGDLLAIVRDLVARSRAPEASLYTVLVDAAERDAELAAHRHAFVRARRRPLLCVLQAGVARGELSPDADLELLADLLAAPLFYRRFVSRTAIDDRTATAIVDVVLAHAAEGGDAHRDASES